VTELVDVMLGFMLTANRSIEHAAATGLEAIVVIMPSQPWWGPFTGVEVDIALRMFETIMRTTGTVRFPETGERYRGVGFPFAQLHTHLNVEKFVASSTGRGSERVAFQRAGAGQVLTLEITFADPRYEPMDLPWIRQLLREHPEVQRDLAILRAGSFGHQRVRWLAQMKDTAQAAECLQLGRKQLQRGGFSEDEYRRFLSPWLAGELLHRGFPAPPMDVPAILVPDSLRI
jgi:hypothetical protein